MTRKKTLYAVLLVASYGMFLFVVEFYFVFNVFGLAFVEDSSFRAISSVEFAKSTNNPLCGAINFICGSYDRGMVFFLDVLVWAFVAGVLFASRACFKADSSRQLVDSIFVFFGIGLAVKLITDLVMLAGLLGIEIATYISILMMLTIFLFVIKKYTKECAVVKGITPKIVPLLPLVFLALGGLFLLVVRVGSGGSFYEIEFSNFISKKLSLDVSYVYSNLKLDAFIKAFFDVKDIVFIWLLSFAGSLVVWIFLVIKRPKKRKGVKLIL